MRGCKDASPASLQLYQTFRGYSPSHCTKRTVLWPSPQGIIGNVSGIGYRSDKWDHRWRDFMHEHCSPLPILVCQYIPKATRKKKRPFQPPESFPILGHVLDIELEPGTFNADALGIRPDAEGYGHIDFKNERDLPYLCGVEDRSMLVICPRRQGHTAMYLWSPILEVEERGIVY